jgi:acyl-CoA thioester hydrolase
MAVETCRTIVYPWQCDAMQHFATQHYMRVFDDATWHLLGYLGYQPHDAGRTRRGWVDVRHEIEYRRELISGDLLVTRSFVFSVGGKSITYCHQISRAHDPLEICTVMTGVTAFFDLDRRAATGITDDFRSAAERLIRKMGASGTNGDRSRSSRGYFASAGDGEPP